MAKRIGEQTIELDRQVRIVGYGSAVGKKEAAGPLSEYYDEHHDDTRIGKKSWEDAESVLIGNAVRFALGRAGVMPHEVGGCFAGDLLNQCLSSTLGLKDLVIPHIGLFGACSTISLATALAAISIDSGAMDTALAASCSHFCAAERQFRFPLDYGGKRTPTSQWTVTGAGALVLSRTVLSDLSPVISRVIFGKIVDLGQNDANNMGAAMAPAAADTLCRFFRDTSTTPVDYDYVVTGDLGRVGSDLLISIMQREGYEMKNHLDCGVMIYGDDALAGAGGSGCGCIGSVLAGYFMKQFAHRKIRRALFCATGALMSTTSSGQGKTIPGIAHAVEITQK